MRAMFAAFCVSAMVATGQMLPTIAADTGSTLVITDSYTTLVAAQSLNLDFNASAQLGGTQFTAGSSYSLSKVTLQLTKVGSPSGAVTVSIRNDSSNNVGGTNFGNADSALATSSITTSYAAYSFTWATPISITSGTKYWIVVSPSGGVSSTNYVNVRQDGTAGAGHFISSWNGTSWSASSTKALYFIAYSGS